MRSSPVTGRNTTWTRGQLLGGQGEVQAFATGTTASARPPSPTLGATLHQVNVKRSKFATARKS